MEPLRQDIIDRLAITSEWAKRPRRADMPILASTEISVDLRSGERHLHRSLSTPVAGEPKRPAVIRRYVPTAICPVCRKEFDPARNGKPGRTRTYCSPGCSQVGLGILSKKAVAAESPAEIVAATLTAGSVGIRHIKMIVSNEFRVDIDRRPRTHRVLTARHAALNLAYEMLNGLSNGIVGRAFGTDHTATIYARRVVAERLADDGRNVEFVAAYRRAEARCKAVLSTGDARAKDGGCPSATCEK